MYSDVFLFMFIYINGYVRITKRMCYMHTYVYGYVHNDYSTISFNNIYSSMPLRVIHVHTYIRDIISFTSALSTLPAINCNLCTYLIATPLIYV